MINSNVSHSCLTSSEWVDAETYWIECTSTRSIEPAIATPSMIAGLFIIAIGFAALQREIASHNVAMSIYRRHRLNRIATRLQQIVALERMLQLNFHMYGSFS
jgi:hypothetical protein